MAIKDKDGKVYSLRGPNPLMKDQKVWNKGNVRLINMKFWDKDVIEAEDKDLTEFNAKILNIGTELDLATNEESATRVIDAKSFVAEIQATPQKEEPVEINANERMYRILKERGMEYHCAPAIDKRTHTDNLYGDKRQYYVYGDKYMFDAIVIDQTDFQLHFWCVRPITVGSIVYHNSKEGRWWRVMEVNEKTGGFMAECGISDSNPDFS